MHLAIYLEEIDQKTLEKLTADGIPIYPIRSGLMVYPTEQRKGDKRKYIYSIPPYLNNGIIKIVDSEKGGKSPEGNSGYGAVVTDIEGNKLHPFRVKGLPSPSGKHAFFQSPKELVRVEAEWGKKGGMFAIKRLVPMPSIGNTATLARFKIYSGEWSKNQGIRLPQKKHKFYEAVEAAISKSLCEGYDGKGCTDLHYTRNK